MRILYIFLLGTFFFSSTALHAQGLFTVDLNFRARSEYRDGARILLDDTRKPTYVSSQRTRLIAGYQQDRYEVRVAIQNARFWGQDEERDNVANMNLAEGWLKYYLNESKDKFAIKVGRQHLVLDDGRIFGMRNWNDIAVSHDLAMLEYEHDDWSFKIGGAYNNDGNKYQESAYDVSYYKYLALLWGHRKLNDYVQLSVMTSVDGNEDEDDFEEIYPRATSGVYVKAGNKESAFGVQASAYYQYGKSTAGLDQRAYMFSVIPTWQINEGLGAAVGINFFSGNDQTRSDAGTVNRSFNKLFGDGHRYYGYMDYFLNIESNSLGGGMQNLFVSLFFGIGERSKLEVSYHNFALGGTLVDTSTSDTVEGQVGNEIDLQFKHTINDALSLTLSYATIFAQSSMEYLKGGDSDRYQQWANVMLIAKPRLFSSQKKE